MSTITAYYKKVKKKGRKFTGVGWVKIMTLYLLTMHVSSWASRCNDFFTGSEQAKGKIVSLHKQSLLMAVEQYHEKSGVLQVEYRKWFDLPIETYKTLHIR